jgi:serine protease Do
MAALAVLMTAPAAGQVRAEKVFREARAYTVRVRTKISMPFMEDERGSFEGAGFLVDARRHWVLTNAHVVGQSPSTVETAFADGVYRPARKIYVDSFIDVAILEVAADGQPHPAATINCDAAPGIGEGVGAFGHPLGLPFTGTRGIISGETDQLLADMLQMDATVDHGNSGGPVISLQDGRIVGIATAGAGGARSERVNFATPMKNVCRILDLLRTGVSPDPPRMEFSLLVDEDGRHTLEVGCTHNAARWPLQPGDRILSVGNEGASLNTMSDLVCALRGRRGSVPIRVERAGRQVEILARPAWRPSVIARRGVCIDGALISPTAFEDSSALGDPPRLIVQSVEPGSAAEALSIQESDMVQSIDGRRFADLDSLVGYLKGRPGGSPLHVVLRRGSASYNRWFEYQVRDLPGLDTRMVGPATQVLSSVP